MLAKFNSFKPCEVCGKFIHKGDPIEKSGGSWIHSECAQLFEQFRITVKNTRNAHRIFLSVDEITYSVSYSLHDALRWALKNSLLNHDFYEQIRKSPFYKSILNFVPD